VMWLRAPGLSADTVGGDAARTLLLRQRRDFGLAALHSGGEYRTLTRKQSLPCFLLKSCTSAANLCSPPPFVVERLIVFETKVR
jgi:hypothetical protein